MARMSLPLLVTNFLVGCQMADREVAGPLGLEDRLNRVAEVRLDDTDRADSFTMIPCGSSGRAVANRPPPLVTQLAVAAQQEWRDELFTLTLGDMGDATQAGQESSGVKSQDSSVSAEREEKYLRRPPLKSFTETAKRDIKSAPHDLWHDTKRVYANPVNLAILGAAYGGSIAIQQSNADLTVEHRFNRNNDLRAPDHIIDDSGWRDAFATVGSPFTHLALAGAGYVLGQQTMNDKTYEVSKTLFSALIINDVTVVIGQAATWGPAPNGEYGTMPSGHTSSSFVVASVMHEAYGAIVGIPLYGMATLVGIERLDDREHYLSDVCMGAVLGTVIGHSVASGRDPEFFGWKILPYANPGNGSGVAFMKTLE